jgi:uroporphyrinogen decarboxylase
LWQPYDFDGRLLALVRDPNMFDVMPDGTVIQPAHQSKMPPCAYVFDAEHGGQPLVLDGDLPKPDLERLRQDIERNRLKEQDAAKLVPFFECVRSSTDRAILYCGPQAGIGIANFGGIAVFPMLCLTEPDFVAELHDLVVSASVERAETLMAHIGPFIDVYQCCSDDWGTQDTTVASPEVFERLFQPYYRRFTDAIHTTSPNVKTFLHSCGAIYDILDQVVDCGFDVLNPVQWTAGGHSYKEWKDKARGRIALWGGGVNAQETLPLGTVDDVARQVSEIVPYMAESGGYVFNGIHNILAEIPGEKVVAMYRAAAAARTPSADARRCS